MSMDSNGKIIFAKHSEIQQANLKNVAGECEVLCAAKFNICQGQSGAGHLLHLHVHVNIYEHTLPLYYCLFLLVYIMFLYRSMVLQICL